MHVMGTGNWEKIRMPILKRERILKITVLDTTRKKRVRNQKTTEHQPLVLDAIPVRNSPIPVDHRLRLGCLTPEVVENLSDARLRGVEQRVHALLDGVANFVHLLAQRVL